MNKMGFCVSSVKATLLCCSSCSLLFFSFPMPDSVSITYIGGPTALLEVAGARFLTDPTFDPPGTAYTTAVYTLHKSLGPAVPREALGHIDAVLLSHDHHFDNLDRAGRAMLSRADAVITTPAGAERLGRPVIGLEPWGSIEIPVDGGGRVRVTSTPARHGPPGGDRGPVTGFAIQPDQRSTDCVYVSGDTVWYEGVPEVARRFRVKVAVLFMGAARVAEVGPAHLTLTAEEGVEVARVMPNATIIPVHFEGWAHFSEGRDAITRAFAAAGIESRLCWPVAGGPVTIPF
jgi:L-ascorbate metabolism protein UlaG (beta-lactamase superfamily)